MDKQPTLINSVKDAETQQNDLQNGSLPTSTVFPDAESMNWQWYVSMIFSTMMSAFIMYVIISLSFFTWKKQLRFRCDVRISNNKNGATLLSMLTLLCASAILVYFLINLPLYVRQYEPYCAIQQRITTVCGIITFVSVYLALWFRVYSLFYSNPVIKKETKKWIRLMSKASVFFLTFMILSNSIVFLTAPPYETSKLGCLKVQSRDGNALKWGMLVTSTVLFQATLLFLFVHPLYLHRKHMLHHGFDSKSVIPVVKRAFITAAICIVSDSAQAVYAIANSQSLGYIRHTAYGLNMVINLVALICSFADWRKRLFPCYFSNKNLSRYGTKSSHVYSVTS